MTKEEELEIIEEICELSADLDVYKKNDSSEEEFEEDLVHGI